MEVTAGIRLPPNGTKSSRRAVIGTILPKNSSAKNGIHFVNITATSSRRFGSAAHGDDDGVEQILQRSGEGEQAEHDSAAGGQRDLLGRVRSVGEDRDRGAGDDAVTSAARLFARLLGCLFSRLLGGLRLGGNLRLQQLDCLTQERDLARRRWRG